MRRALSRFLLLCLVFPVGFIALGAFVGEAEPLVANNGNERACLKALRSQGLIAHEWVGQSATLVANATLYDGREVRAFCSFGKDGVVDGSGYAKPYRRGQ